MKKCPLEMIQVKTGWHWRLRATNGRIVADGAEMYSSEAKAQNGFKAAAKLAAKALAGPIGQNRKGKTKPKSV